MMKFKALQFVASISADLTGEFDELEEMIAANKAGADNAHDIHRTYNHLGSLIQGMEYMSEFIADDDDRQELTEVLKDLRDQRDGFYPRVASIVFSKKLGRPVGVTVFCHSNGSKEYSVRTGEDIVTFESTDGVKAYIKSLEA